MDTGIEANVTLHFVWTWPALASVSTLLYQDCPEPSSTQEKGEYHEKHKARVHERIYERKGSKKKLKHNAHNDHAHALMDSYVFFLLSNLFIHCVCFQCIADHTLLCLLRVPHQVMRRSFKQHT